MDHKNNLESNCLRPTMEQMFENFKKIIPDLMIDQSKKQALKIQQLEQEKTELVKLKESKIKSDILTKNLFMSLIEDPVIKDKMIKTLLDSGKFKRIDDSI